MNLSSPSNYINSCYSETNIVKSKEETREEVMIMMDNDDDLSQSLIANNDNVTWCQELARSWRSYDLMDKIMVIMYLSLINIIIIMFLLSKIQNILEKS